jgi:hypothetical protein
MLQVDHLVGDPFLLRGPMAGRNGVFLLIATVVDKDPHGKRFENVFGPADMVRMGMGDPNHVDAAAAEVLAKPIHDMTMPAETGGAVGAMGTLSRVHQNSSSVRQVHKRGQGLTGVVEVNGEGPF